MRVKIICISTFIALLGSVSMASADAFLERSENVCLDIVMHKKTPEKAGLQILSETELAKFALEAAGGDEAVAKQIAPKIRDEFFMDADGVELLRATQGELCFTFGEHETGEIARRAAEDWLKTDAVDMTEHGQTSSDTFDVVVSCSETMRPRFLVRSIFAGEADPGENGVLRTKYYLRDSCEGAEANALVGKN
ncbi:MAG: hypothetical protein ABJ327_16085 [Litoreibacter sp.]